MIGKGEEMGMFRMGSTVAVVCEVPKGYTVKKQPGDKVKLGELLVAP